MATKLQEALNDLNRLKNLASTSFDSTNDGLYGDDDDEDVDFDEEKKEKDTGENSVNISCNALRKKITMFLATKEMTLTSFLDLIGVNSSSYQRFMNLKGAYNGIQNSMYWGAKKFFAERARDEKKAKLEAKKAEKELKKTGKETKRPISEVNIPNESLDNQAKKAKTDLNDHVTKENLLPKIIYDPNSKEEFPKFEKRDDPERIANIRQLLDNTPLPDDNVYEDCDEVRRKVSILFASNALTMKTFSSLINISSQTVSKFLAKKGEKEGAGQSIYPAAYHFFERIRVGLNIPKSNKRKISQTKHPNGFALTNPPTHMWVLARPF